MPNSPSESDPRLAIVAAWLALDNIASGDIKASAEMMLDELDNESPEPTIRRLQQTIGEMYGGDAVEWNLGRASMIVNELADLAGVQSALKAAFKNDELDGGWKTALEHPLYLQAEARKASLQDELKGLI